MPCQLDSYLRTLQTTVASCVPLASSHKLHERHTRSRPQSPRWVLTLDRSPLYPEGGGQPSDTGIICPLSPADPEEPVPWAPSEQGIERGLAARVLHVSRHDGTVEHVVTAPLVSGASVLVRVDWARRYDHMQQHTGVSRMSFV